MAASLSAAASSSQRSGDPEDDHDPGEPDGAAVPGHGPVGQRDGGDRRDVFFREGEGPERVRGLRRLLHAVEQPDDDPRFPGPHVSLPSSFPSPLTTVEKFAPPMVRSVVWKSCSFTSLIATTGNSLEKMT